jgi:hypothetical protein
MPQRPQRPQRKAAAAAREKLLSNKSNKKATPDKGAGKAGKLASGSPDLALKKTEPSAQKAAPLPQARVQAMKKEEGQTDRDKHTQEKKEEEGSTAPLPEKVRVQAPAVGWVLASVSS